MDDTLEQGYIAAAKQRAEYQARIAYLVAAYDALEIRHKRAMALIAAIATHLDSPSWGHELMSADDGLLVECQGQDVLRAMLEDYKNDNH